MAIYDDVKITINLNELVGIRAKLLTQYEDYSKAVKELKQSDIKFKKLHLDKNICKISIVGVGMKSNVGVAQKMFETLAKRNINIQVISTSEIKISVLIPVEKKKNALNALHKAYNLFC